ncbi:DUF1592 domain-containing protein [Haloferula sargassicola]|uniref:DUF1592 domain-containing protein n=1 Tax=Haloferula sargassicola TaxID=490096 RepID=A0ABP9ULD7_9BACT
MRIVSGAILFLLTASALAVESWKDQVLPVFENYCYDCHGDGVKKGELDLDRFPNVAAMQANRDVWKRIRQNLTQHLMPPPDEYQPSSDERQALVDWIDAAVFPVDPEHPDPGRVTLRRLNRTEYQNTLRDLLGVPVKVMELLPPDDSGYGFDNIGDVLTLSPAHLDKYLDAARIGLQAATHPGEMPFPSREMQGRKLEGDGRADESGRFLFTNGRVRARFAETGSGPHRLVIRAGGTTGPKGPPVIRVLRGETTLRELTAAAPMEQPGELVLDLRIEGGEGLDLQLEFINDSYDETAPPGARDTNLLIESVSLVGPLDGPRQAKPESHRRIFVQRAGEEGDEAWITRVYRGFARRAFRRPLETGEAERYWELYRLGRDQGQDVEQAAILGLEAMLVSPSFLFREEPQPEPDQAGSIHAIDEHALATRLSYFFWSTMPDEHLSQLADEGKLRGQLEAEVDRLIDSPRSRELIRNFGGQWLQLRDLNLARPSNRFYRGFDLALRGDMRRETELLLEHLIRDNRPVTELLDADYTFVNERLARHYGIGGVEGRKFRRVSLEGTHRRGLLGQGSFHLLTSLPIRTSPVMRGKYVLENLLDTAPPPPPPNVPQLESPQGGKNHHLSLREQMVKHRQDPACSACHALMDPIGFGLENFDADGSWRDQENGKPLDVSGELADGRTFNGADELRQILVSEHREDLMRSVASKLLTYALGRGTDWYDKPALDHILQQTEQAGGGLRSMLHAVVESVPFQYRRGDGN